MNFPTGYTYQWLRCSSTGASCASIKGATGEAYVPVAEDVGHELRVDETAFNPQGFSAPAESSATAVVVPPVPVDSTVPTMTGTAQQAQTLTEHHGEWTNSPTGYTYRWMRCSSTGTSCTAIGGATNQTYVPVAEDVGHELRVSESASNAGGSGSPVESKATAVVVPPVPVSSKAPTVTGTAQQGQTLTEHHGEWSNSPTGYTYQWLRCNSLGAGCLPISSATSATYSPVAEDVGSRLRVSEIASNAGGSGTASESEATSVVVPPVPVDSKVPTVTGTAQQGQTLTEHHGEWSQLSDRLRLPVVAVQRLRVFLQHDRGCHQRDLLSRRRRCRPRAACDRDRQQRGRLGYGGRIGSHLGGRAACAGRLDGPHGDGHRPAGSDVDRAPRRMVQLSDGLCLPVVAVQRVRKLVRRDRWCDERELLAGGRRRRARAACDRDRRQRGRVRYGGRIERDRGGGPAGAGGLDGPHGDGHRPAGSDLDRAPRRMVQLSHGLHVPVVAVQRLRRFLRRDRWCDERDLFAGGRRRRARAACDRDRRQRGRVRYGGRIECDRGRGSTGAGGARKSRPSPVPPSRVRR